MLAGREVATGRKVAIKKIKVGQFKDGLDMSAIREVKYLRELRHQNIIEVCTPPLESQGSLLLLPSSFLTFSPLRRTSILFWSSLTLIWR